MLEQEARARLQAAEAALERIDDLEREEWTRGDSIDRLRGIYHYRRKRFAARFDDDVDDGAIEERSERAVERDLDLEERRLNEVR